MSGAVEGVEEPRVQYARAIAGALTDREDGEDAWRFFLVAADAVLGLTTPPARSYADGVEDAANVADDFEGSASLERADDPCSAVGQEIAAAIRLLSQDTNEGTRP